MEHKENMYVGTTHQTPLAEDHLQENEGYSLVAIKEGEHYKTKRSIITACMLVAAVLCPVFRTKAQIVKASSREEAQLSSIYRKLDDAFRAKQVRSLISYYHKDFSFNDGSKTSRRSEFVDELKMRMNLVSEISETRTEIIDISIVKNLYLVRHNNTAKGTLKLPGGKIKPFEYRGERTDTWIRGRRTGWKLLGIVEHDSEFSVEGESVPGSRDVNDTAIRPNAL